MLKEYPKKRGSYDYYLICATAVIFFIISAICIYGMFYFKLAQIHQMQPAQKIQYMESMNTFISPFLIGLIVLLGICVPKRLFPVQWVNRFSIMLIIIALLTSLLFSVKTGLLLVLLISAFFQALVLGLAVLGSEKLHFEKKGYWVRVGSSLIHLGMILFILDLFLHKHQTLHLILFWITTFSIVSGMLCCFYSDSAATITGKAKALFTPN